MTNDEDYWKHAYQHAWKTADEKVDGIIELIKQSTKKDAKKVGFGADSTEFISGSASQHGFKKGDADLQVVGTNIFLEVTGPNIPTVPATSPLWVRPDKLQNACADGAKETWVIHVLPTSKEPLIRVIQCNAELCKRYAAKEFAVDNPMIRGRRETYVSIPAADKCVLPIKSLLDRIAGF